MSGPVKQGSREIPAQAARRIFNPGFLEALGRQFKFDGKGPEITAALVRMGISYLALKRQENTREIQLLRRRYKKFAAEINAFRKSLKNDAEIPLLMYFSALQLNEPPPQSEFPGLTPHERQNSGEPYVRELLRLLDILSEGLKQQIGRSGSKSGPRTNLALKSLALKAGEFFAQELNGRSFTIDPHKPFKATKAFDFVKALVEPLDKVTDDDIITAIRAAKAKLRPQKK